MRRHLTLVATFATAVLSLGLSSTIALAETPAEPTPVSTVVSAAAAPGGAAGTTSVVSLPYGGMTRTYRLFVPTALPTGPRPLVLMLHGLTTTAAWMELRGTDAGAAASGTLVAYPEGVDSSWNAGICCGSAFTKGVDD